MAAITDLLQEVAQKARKCPNPTLIQAYRNAARRFCVQSRWLRRELEIITEQGENQYDLVPDTGDSMLEIIGVRVVTIINPQAQNYRIDPSDPMGWNPAMPPGAPATWCYVPESEIGIFPTADAGGYTMVCTVECQPMVSVVELPDDLLRKWDQALSAGTLAYLLNIHGQPWSNPGMARENAVLFQAAINNAKADVARAYNTGTSMARIRRLF